jgi:hypothetical protein
MSAPSAVTRTLILRGGKSNYRYNAEGIVPGETTTNLVAGFRMTLARERVFGFLQFRQNQAISLNDIAVSTGIKRRTVINTIKQLEKSGWLEVSRTRLAANFSARNSYALTPLGSAKRLSAGSANFAPKEVEVVYRRDCIRTLPLRKNEKPGVAGAQGAAAPEERKEGIVIVEVGCEEVINNGMGVRGKGAKRREPRPPDPDEIRILDHFQHQMTERMVGPVPFITPSDKKALRTLRWAHQGDPCATTEKFLQCIDNACASFAFPFYRRAFSLKEFCQASPLHKFGDPAAATGQLNVTPNRVTRLKKPVSQVVAESGHSYLLELERLNREDEDSIDAELFNDVIDGANQFCEYVDFPIAGVDRAELSFEFLEILANVMEKHRDKGTLPGVLMCKVADECIDRRRQAGEPVVPIPPSFFRHKSKLRAKEGRVAKEQEADE